MKRVFFGTFATVLLSSVFAFAQEAPAPVAETPAPVATPAQDPAAAPAVQEAAAPVTPEAVTPAPQEAATPAPAEAPVQEEAPVQPAVVEEAAPAAPAVDPAEPVPAEAPAEQVAAPVEEAVPAPAETVPVVEETAPVAAEAAPVAAPVPVVEAAPVAEPQASLLSGTELTGEIHGFLKSDKSPYLVNGTVSIAPNTVLVIEPGTTIMFTKGGSMLINQGQLVVAGTSANPVVFRSALSTPAAGDWAGIVITGENNSEIRNAQVLNATNGIVVENGNLKIQNSLVEGASGYGVYARNASIVASDCQFKNNQVALNLSHYAQGEIERSTFDGNSVGLLNSKLSMSVVSSSDYEKTFICQSWC